MIFRECQKYNFISKEYIINACIITRTYYINITTYYMNLISTFTLIACVILYKWRVIIPIIIYYVG